MAYSPRTGETLVNAHTVNDQIDPAVTRLANGNLVVVWSTSTNASNTAFGIQAQFYDPLGNPIGTPFFINQIGSRNQVDLDITPLPNGGFAVSWTGFGLGISIAKMQFFNSAGTATGPEIQLDAGSDFWVGSTDIAALPNGSVVAVWNGGTGNFPDIEGSIVAPDGTIQDFTVASTTTGAQSAPTVAVLSNGTFVVTWSDTSGLGGDADGGIKGQRFDSTGTPIGG